MGSARRSPKPLCLALLARGHFPGASPALTPRYPPASSGREPRTILGPPPPPSPSPQPASPPLPRRGLGFGRQAAAATPRGPSFCPNRLNWGEWKAGAGPRRLRLCSRESAQGRGPGPQVWFRLPGRAGRVHGGTDSAAPTPEPPVHGREATGKEKGPRAPAGAGWLEPPAAQRRGCGLIPQGALWRRPRDVSPPLDSVRNVLPGENLKKTPPPPPSFLSTSLVKFRTTGMHCLIQHKYIR